MAHLIANKDEEYSSVLPETKFYPALKISEFQSLFHFLSDETESGILYTAKVQRIKIHKELKPLTDKYNDLLDVSNKLFDDEETALDLYKQAVFCKTASALIGNRLSTDATKEAADRQEALNDRSNKLLTEYRESIDLLLDIVGFSIEVI